MGEYRDVRVGGLITSLRETRTEDLEAQLAEAQAEVERLRTELSEAESCLWRIAPATHTIGGEPDPFEGHGETYRAAYERLRADGERLKVASAELLEVADLRGDSSLPHPCDDEKLWSARMQDAWDFLREALDAARATTKEPTE